MGLFGKRRGYEAPDYMTPGGGIGGDINRQQSESPLRDGGNWMRNLAMSLGAAQSFRDGDFNQGASLLDYVGQQGEAKRKAMQDEEQRRGLLRQLIAAGIPPEKAPLIIAGAAKYGDVAPGTTKADRVQDNAGNYWTKGADGKWALDFVDNTERTFFNNGMQITVPNRYSGANVGTQAPGYQPQVNVGGEMLTPPRLGGGIPTVRTEQDYYALPAGTQYMDPNGILKRKGNR